MREEFYAEYREIENRHWWFLARWRIFTDVIKRECNSHPLGPRILDVGCGMGTMLGHLQSLGLSFGLDAALEGVRVCHSRGHARVTQGAASRLPLESRSFDLICALDLLEHVHDDVACLHEFGRVCCPEGKILISVPAYRFLWGRQDEIACHLRRYTARGLSAKARAAGLVVHRVTYFNTILFPIISLVRVVHRLSPPLPGDTLQSDFTLTRPGRLNDLLTHVFAFESKLLERMCLPFGVSILMIASPSSQARRGSLASR